jgi:tetratricopeptide (TPR) repeat protein
VNEPEPLLDPLHDGQDGEVDADFLYHLYRGGELLAGGKNFEARDELERANHLKPRDQKAQSLLGLVYFKLGLLDRAIDVYDRLVRDNPSDATLRTNLGLVHLKAGQISQAIDQLEAAVGVVPDHSKALNYLGLAYAQAQAHDKAREAFERAGNPAMARKMERALQGDGTAAKEDERVTSEPTDGQERWLTSSPEPKMNPRNNLVGDSPSPLSPPDRMAPPIGLAELARASAYAPATGSPFQVDGTGVTLKLAGQLRSRLSGLLWVRGEIQRQGEQKRFRGRATEKTFGEGAERVFRLTGSGQVVLGALGRTFTPVSLDDEAAYLVEDVLFSFEDSLWYENGRVPSKTPPDLNLVHLRGRGKALLRSPGRLRSAEIRAGEPLQLPIDRLLGWIGQLTPTLLLPDTSEQTGQVPMGRWLRLEGEGWVLWALPSER